MDKNETTKKNAYKPFNREEHDAKTGCLIILLWIAFFYLIGFVFNLILS